MQQVFLYKRVGQQVTVLLDQQAEVPLDQQATVPLDQQQELLKHPILIQLFIKHLEIQK